MIGYMGKYDSMPNVMHAAPGVSSRENPFKQGASKHSSETWNELLNSKWSGDESRKTDMKGKGVDAMSFVQDLFFPPPVIGI